MDIYRGCRRDVQLFTQDQANEASLMVRLFLFGLLVSARCDTNTTPEKKKRNWMHAVCSDRRDTLWGKKREPASCAPSITWKSCCSPDSPFEIREERS